MNIIIWDYESVWPDVDLKIIVGHSDLYFMVQWFCVLAWRLFDVWTSYFRIMGQYDQTFDLKKCKSLWPIFHGPVILPCILKTIWFMNKNIWDYDSVWPYVWPEINVAHCDLYFMVQWFCRISWRLFDARTSWFGIMSQYDLKINIGHYDLYFMVQWFCIISKTVRCMNIILWDNGSVWPDVWPQNRCRSMLPIFHGPVVLSYISKTIWCMSVIFQIMRQCDPNFDLKVNISQHDLYFMV